MHRRILALLALAGLVVGLMTTPPAAAQAAPALMVSSSADRSAPGALEGAGLSRPSYVFLDVPATGVARVEFHLDDPQRTRPPRQVEKSAPYDFAGGTVSTATAWDPATAGAGTHSITAAVFSTSGAVQVLTSTFTVESVQLRSAPSSLSLSAQEGGAVVSAPLDVTTDAPTATTFTASTDRSWLKVSPTGGTTPGRVTVSADPAVAGAGSWTGTVTLSAPGVRSASVPVALQVSTTGSGHDVVYSSSPKRTAAATVEGSTLSGVVYPYLSPSTGVSEVRFWVDDPTRSGPPTRIDGKAPFDLGGSNADGSPKPYDTSLLPDGPHRLTTQYLRTDGTTGLLDQSFRTSNGTNNLSLSPSSIAVQLDPGDLPVQRTLTVDAVQPGTAVALSSDAAWLRVPQGPLVAPSSVTVTVDPTGLDAGSYSAAVTASAPSAFSARTAVTLLVGDPGACRPIACRLVKVATPYTLDWLYDAARVLDAQGTGTGLTTVLPRPDGRSSYLRPLVDVDLNSGVLTLGTTSGSFGENTQDNALGVGFDGPKEETTLSTTLVDVPVGTQKYEQAGLWFGYGQDDVQKLVVMSTSQGQRVEYLLEVGGTVVAKKSALVTVGSEPLTLSLSTEPATRKVTASYKIGTTARRTLGTVTLPGEFFSFDGAGIDPQIATRSFAGVMATHRAAAAPTTFRFSEFSVTARPPAPDVSDYTFDRVSHESAYPTSMAFGPDGRLYTTDLFGGVHRMTVDADHRVVEDRVSTVLGKRLALGIAIDPASTPDDVAVWVAHSSPVTAEGVVDSGVVSRLSGPDLSRREDVITGLPRSIANHGTNSLHFAPDGRLFIAQGGNTGAGAANTAQTEFGDRGEQALSNALLVADVRAAGFDGSCQNVADMYGPAPCDVRVWASGIRNTYDFLLHSNGRVYGPDNGLGVVGSYPPTPTAPCTGFGDTRSYKQGGHNPGTQNDALNLLVEGGYYGYPNPVRDECVFKDGSYQGVAAPPNYRVPMFDLGPDRSTNGIVEYRGGAFCGDLEGDILTSNYSVGDDVVHLDLSPDGTSVLRATSLVTGLQDPLPLVVGPTGAVWVGEFGGGRITALVPRDLGCWTQAPPLPQSLLDPGSAVLDDDLYVVGGKTSSSHLRTVWVYDGSTGSWSSAPPLPGVGVENPAVVGHAGHLYVFGGSTAPFSGAQVAAHRYDPATGSWTRLADMPVARAGATAQVLDGAVLVVGGAGADGASLATSDRYDLVSGTWSTGPTMSTARDNPGSAVLDGRLHVFGGRTRRADGSVVNGMLASVEALDPVTQTWSPRAPMPTGRRTMVVGVVDGRAVVVGGEERSDGAAFDAVEAYDPGTDTWTTSRTVPAGRHGAAGGVLRGRLHVVGGGERAGSSFSDLHHVFTGPRRPGP